MKKLIYFIVIALFFVSGCSLSDNNLLAGLVTQPLSFDPPRSIDGFGITNDDDNLYVRFSLLDGNQKETAADGTIILEVMSNDDKILYQGEFNVLKSDFGSYYFKTSGQKFFAYLWSIPLLEVKKSPSVFGKAKLTFITKEGEKFESVSNYVVVPSYTPDELEKLSEELYSNSAVQLDILEDVDGLELLLTKAGRFSPLMEYGTSKSYLRIDMEVTNKGKGDSSLYTHNAIVMDQMGDEHAVASGGTFDGKSILLGEKRTGYILFDDFPAESNVAVLRLEHGYNEKLEPKFYEFRIVLG